MKTAVLITCWNERERILTSLEQLFRQIDLMKTEGLYEFTVFLADGGSTDGTIDELDEKYSQLTLVRGSHRKNWIQGTNLAWETAAKEDFDFYILLSSKIRLEEGALESMMENSKFLRHKVLLTGSVADSKGNIVSGGRTKKGKIVQPDPLIPVPCYNFEGDLVLVPKAVYSKVGMLDKVYNYKFADYDYGVRACKAGIQRAVAPGVLAKKDAAAPLPRWRDASYTIKDRFKYMTATERRIPRELFIYDCRRIGFFGAMGRMVALYFKMLTTRKQANEQSKSNS